MVVGETSQCSAHSSPAAPYFSTRYGSLRRARMDIRLLEAARSGDSNFLFAIASRDRRLLHETTPQGNTCLHIASIHGHEGFCEDVVVLSPGLLSSVNADRETPLLTATTSGHASLASVLLRCCHASRLSHAILKQDKHGCNALHHAIRSGHRELAMLLIEAEPALSRTVNNRGESPMFISVMRNYADIFEKLLDTPGSSHAGAHGCNVLHAAVRNGNSAIAKKIMETRPGLAREENKDLFTPIYRAVLWNKIDVLKVLLDHDRSLGYLLNSKEHDLLNGAAYRGNIDIARVLLKYCPDAPYCCNTNGWTCLHQAVWHDQADFLEFILGSQQLRKLINMRAGNGKTALHYAIQKCNPRIVRALLRHKDIDVTVLDDAGYDAMWGLSSAGEHAKTLNWNEVSMLMVKVDPEITSSAYNLQKSLKDEMTNTSRKEIKSLTQLYTSNTSLVAILIATITFAAAFTLPGGYSSATENEGLPIMSRKLAFQAFLIADALAMCSSLLVAFVCIIAKWEDLEFLIYYRSFTKKLMWFAYMTTTIAFATGLYTILAPRLLWLAISICIMSVLLPFVTWLLGAWPVWKLRLRLGRTFKSELLDMV